MGYCELCGKETQTLYKVKIEDSILEVCSECKKYADEVLGIVVKKEVKKVTTRDKKEKTVEEEVDLIEDYNVVIREAREKMGLTIEELAKQLNEKESVIRRIEEGRLIPDEKLVRKLEKFFDIKLTQHYENGIYGSKEKDASKEITIGDVVEIK